jgi:hypothetical protein
MCGANAGARAVGQEVEPFGTAVAVVGIDEPREVAVHEHGEVGEDDEQGQRQLMAMAARPGRVLGQAHMAEVDVGIAAGDVRVLVMTHVVAAAPGLLVDGHVPGEAVRLIAVGAGEAVVGAVQRGMPDLGGLELLV